MEVDANLTVGEPAQALDEEQHDAVKHVDNQENGEEFGEFVLNDGDDVLVPVILDDFDETARLILRGHGQKVHDCLRLAFGML